jgi:hypothetical protein
MATCGLTTLFFLAIEKASCLGRGEYNIGGNLTSSYAEARSSPAQRPPKSAAIRRREQVFAMDGTATTNENPQRAHHRPI